MMKQLQLALPFNFGPLKVGDRVMILRHKRGFNNSWNDPTHSNFAAPWKAGDIAYIGEIDVYYSYWLSKVPYEETYNGRFEHDDLRRV